MGTFGIKLLTLLAFAGHMLVGCCGHHAHAADCAHLFHACQRTAPHDSCVEVEGGHQHGSHRDGGHHHGSHAHQGLPAHDHEPDASVDQCLTNSCNSSTPGQPTHDHSECDDRDCQFIPHPTTTYAGEGFSVCYELALTTILHAETAAASGCDRSLHLPVVYRESGTALRALMHVWMI